MFSDRRDGMNMGMGWVAFWGFAGRAVIAAAVIWISIEAADLIRAIYVP